MKRPSIAIVGAGPSGLCLGALLHQRGIPFTIYELRDRLSPAALSAAPSGMLDLHEASGLAAIRSCGLWHRFLPLTADCGQGTIVMDRDGTVQYRDDGGGGDANRPEIARNELVGLLLSATPAESVAWGHKLRGAAPTADGRVQLDFGDRGTREHDFVVGADGAWSRVRGLVTDVGPRYGGISYATLHIAGATDRRPALADMVGDGSCFILGGGNGLVSHRGARGAISVHVSAASDDEHALQDRTRDLDPEQWRRVLLGDAALFGSWSPAVHELISAGCDEEAARAGSSGPPPMKPLYMLPVGHEWPARPGVALVGDAAHLMMPWAGEGVNLALRDSLDLAEAIAKAWDEYSSSPESQSFPDVLLLHVAGFDRAMFARARIAAQETWTNSKLLFSQDGARAMADLMASFGAPE
ncbi:FAD binding domain-containing protein [Hirsutella rhossiliensis]|uniref:FAD binding domain-containing protein n=1 Tax=Hirsutella rhossiliensis TaxID=111463 RepID=A0A9P8MRR9_9HYPO|nr:FAD binding domain-containing protein [Hirsutella rhossiliensis]KAH0960212.1 FAD binding domain-containing protein [Hirsutella rhossiliensis]